MSDDNTQPDLFSDLAAPISRLRVVEEISLVLGVTRDQALEIVDAFDALVSQPLERNLGPLPVRVLTVS